jgi:hypothetical protein
MDHIQGDASFHRQIYFIEVPRRFSFNEILNPEWFRGQTKLRVNDLLELVAEDGRFDVLARVVQADRGGYCVLRILREWYADTDAVQSGITDQGPHIALVPQHGWTLFDAVGQPIARFATEDSAKAALIELAETQPAPAPVGEFIS